MDSYIHCSFALDIYIDKMNVIGKIFNAIEKMLFSYEKNDDTENAASEKQGKVNGRTKIFGL